MIHPTALVSHSAKIGNNVSIGAFSIIHDDVTIGDNCKIDAYCELGYPTSLAKQNKLIIGNDSLIRSHSVFYMGSNFATGLQTGHRVTVRENTIAGKNLRIGTLTDIQGDINIGDYVRIHSNVFIAQGASIGNFVWIFPHVVLTNDPHPPSHVLKGVTVEDFAAIAAMSTILPGVIIGKHSLVGAQSCVTKNVPPHMVVRGTPAKPVCATNEIHLTDNPEKSAYPWPTHFHRGYPEEIISAWQKEFAVEDI